MTLVELVARRLARHVAAIERIDVKAGADLLRRTELGWAMAAADALHILGLVEGRRAEMPGTIGALLDAAVEHGALGPEGYAAAGRIVLAIADIAKAAGRKPN